MDWDGTPIWLHGQLPDDPQLCEQSSRPQKGPAIRVAQPWADKQVRCPAVATAGASRRPWHGLNAAVCTRHPHFHLTALPHRSASWQCMVKPSSKSVQHQHSKSFPQLYNVDTKQTIE